MGQLYFGDNLHMMRLHLADESVDLVYLDPPFNSKAQCNVLFKTPAGAAADAQLEAFQDSWHWGEAAEAAYADVIHAGGGAVRFLAALRSSLGENVIMAYLAMMTVRLVEQAHVLCVDVGLQRLSKASEVLQGYLEDATTLAAAMEVLARRAGLPSPASSTPGW